MSIIQDPFGAGAANVVDAESPDFTSKKALAVAISADYSRSNQTTSGTLSGTTNVAISTAAASACGIQISGTWTGTILFESTIDGSNWVAIIGSSIPGNITTTSTSTNGVWLVSTTGINSVRVRANTIGTGSASVTLSASLVAQEVTVTSTIGITDAQLRASPVAVTPSLPTGAATATLQNSINTSLTDISGQLPTALGAKTTANSMAVTIASDQTVAVSASSLPLPTGAAQDSTLTGGSQKTQVTALPAIPTGSNTIGAVNQGTGGVSAWKVDGSGVTQPVSAASLPLPSGAATSALQTSGNSTLSAISGQLPASLGAKATSASVAVNIASDQTVPVSGTVTATQSTAANLNATVVGAGVGGTPAGGVLSVQGVASMTALKVDGSGVTQPVSATALPLPTGASTAALQTTGNSTLTAISGQIPSTLGAKTTAASLAVNIASDQTVPVSVATFPLPTGAATSANQTGGGQKTQVVDASGNVQPAGDTVARSLFQKITDGFNGPVAVKAASTAPAATDPSLVVSISPNTPTLPVSASALPLPTGAATAALQSTISGQLPGTLGSKITSASLAVNIASDQTVPVSASALPLPSGAATSAKQPALGAAGTPSTDVLTVQGNASGTPIPVSGTVALTTGSSTVGKVDQGAAGASAWKVDGSAVTQPISAASLPLPTGAATSANLTTLGAQTTKLNDGTNTATVKAASTAAVATDTALVVAISPNSPITTSGTSVVTQSTAANLNATVTQGPAGATAWKVDGSAVTQPVSGTVTANQGSPGATAWKVDGSAVTQPVSGSLTAVQASAGNLNATVAQGAAGAAAWKVDGSAVTQPVSAAALPLPTGAATSALQTTGNTSLSAIAGQLPSSLGAKTTANSMAVNIASDQTVPVSALILPLPSGASTAAKQPALGVAGTPSTDVLTIQGITSMTALKVDGSGITQPVSGTFWQATQPVSAASLPLPTGAATSANLTTIGSQTTKINDGTNTAAVKAASTAPLAADPSLVVAISPNTATLPVSAASLPLPTGAATSALQTTGNSSLTTISGQLPASLGAKTTAASMAVNIASDQNVPVTGTITAAQATAGNLNATVVQGAAGASAWKVDGSAVTQPVSAAALPLPTGAATSANQTTLGSQTSKINDGTYTATIKTSGTAAVTGDTALVVALSPNSSTPNTLDLNNTGSLGSLNATVVFNCSGMSTATISVTGTWAGTTQFQGSVDGTNWFSADAWNMSTGLFVTSITSNGNFLSGIAGLKQFRLIMSSYTSGTASVAYNISVRESTQQTGNLIVDANNNGPVTVKQASTAPVATDMALVVAISPNSPTLATSVSSLPLPTGASTAALQTSGNATLTTISGQLPATLGAKTIANSASVNIASDQTVPVSAATLPLPSGAATSALQTSGNSTLTTISGQLPTTLGTKTIANSVAVNIASDQTVPVSGTITAAQSTAANLAATVTQGPAGASAWKVDGSAVTQPVSATALPLPTGAATSANQTTIGSQTSKINDGTNTATVKAASTSPVVTDTSLVVAISPNTATLPISAASLPLPSGAATAANLTTLGSQTSKINDGTNTATVKAASTAAAATDTALVVAISPNNTLSVSASALPLPTGASTAALQTTGNSTLTTISGQLPATLGAKTTANSTAVNIASDQTVPVSAIALPLPTGAATSANQTTLGSQTSKINDGTNTATVKAASTASAATDTSLVIALSPNSPLPTGTNALGSVSVSNFPGTQAVSAASLPLPTGASTAANQTTLGSQTSKINDGTNTATVKAASTAPIATDTALVVALSPNTASLAVTGTFWQATQPVSAAALPLPTGASTAALQTTGNSTLTTISGQLPATLGAKATTASVAVNIASDQTVPVSATALPLPTGAATSANLTTLGSQTSKINDGTNTATIKAASTAPLATDTSLVVSISPNTSTLPISAASLPLPSGAATSANLTTLGSQTSKINDGTNTASVKAASTAAVAADPALVVAISPNNTIAVSASALPLPSGAATSALQTTGNSTLTTISGQLPATLGTKTTANSVAVNIASDQTVAVSASTLPLPTGAATAAKQPALGVAGTPSTDVLTIQGAASMIALKTDGSAVTQPVSGTFWQTTQPVSATALPLPTGASTAALQTTGNSALTTISGQIPASLGAKATAASLAVNIASDQTVPVSASALPLPSGAATSALQTTGNSTLTAISGQLPASLGTKTTANSIAINVASDQTVPVSAIALPLPSGAASATNQVTIGSQTSKINDGVNTATIKAASAVAVATDTALVVAISPNNTVPVSATSLPLPTGSATSALQTTGNSTLTTISGQIPTTLGAKTTANSMAVNIASDQTVPISAIVMPLPTGAASSANQTTLGSQTSKINDGTNTASVKAASTAAVVGDSALVVALSPNSLTPLTADLTGSGSLGVLNATVSFSTSGISTAAIGVTGTWVGTIQFQASIDGTNWFSDSVINIQGGSFVSNTTVSGNFVASVAGYRQYRLQMSAYTSGSATITYNLSCRDSTQQVGSLIIDGNANGPVAVKPASTAAIATDAALVVAISPNSPMALPSGASTSANQTTLGSQTTKLNDGTNTATIKAASTAAIATDTALVVAMSPNSPFALPTGASTSANQITIGSQTTKINDGTNTAAVKAASTAAVAADPALVVSLSPNSHINGILRPLYGTGGQAMTITLASLASTTARASTDVDNTTNLYEDILFFVKTTAAAAAVSATGYVNIYGYGTVDGTTYPEAITGTDAAVTLSSPPNLVLLAQITLNANNKTATAGPFSFCRQYGVDRLPSKWGLVLVNLSGAALNATAGNHAITWQGVNGQLI